MNHFQYYYQTSTGKQQGPVDLLTLAQKWQAQEISAQSLVFSPFTQDWIPLGSLEYYYQNHLGNSEGPLNLLQLRRLYKSENISLKNLIHTSDSQKWIPLEHLFFIIQEHTPFKQSTHSFINKGLIILLIVFILGSLGLSTLYYFTTPIRKKIEEKSQETKKILKELEESQQSEQRKAEESRQARDREIEKIREEALNNFRRLQEEEATRRNSYRRY